MFRRFLLYFFLISSGLFVGLETVQAGFGISPPYVKTAKPIAPGSHYEQRITLLRSSAENDLQAMVSINAPEIESWVSIEQGNVFDLPAGELQVPMVVRLDVPKDATIGNYKGYINIKIGPKDASAQGGVAIALGARIDIDIDVTNETFLDFVVRRVQVKNFEYLAKPWSYRPFVWLFHRLPLELKIENTGNARIAPTKVKVDVYDVSDTVMLAATETKRVPKVDPFATKDVVAKLPVSLEAGQYWAHVSVYREKEIVYKEKMTFTISPPNQADWYKAGLWPWLSLLASLVLFVVLIYLLIVIKIWLYLFYVVMILLWPLRLLWRLIVKRYRLLKKQVLRGLARKISKYDDN